MKDFGRLLTAMVTPFKKDASVDFEKVGVLAERLADSGSDGIVVSGTTGESPTLLKDEKLALFERVCESVSGKAAVIAGTGSNNTQASMALTREAESLGVDGIMAVVPYYNKPSQEGLYRHFESIAASTRLPVIVYNVPARTSVNLFPETVRRLALIDNIVGIKEAANDIDQATEVLRLCPPEFRLYSGNDSWTLPLLALGGYGVISVASHVVGPQMKEMITKYLQGKVEEAAELNLQLFPVFQVMFITNSPVPIKAALALRGFEAGEARLPLGPMTEEQMQTLEQTLNSFFGAA